MKEELQGKLVEILTSIKTATGKAADFAMEQLPDIAQSYVMFGRIYGTLLVLCGVALLVASYFLIAKGARDWRRGEDEYRKDHPRNEYRILYRDKYAMGFIPHATGAVAAIVGTLVVLANMGSTMLAWLAPKVWLLKELAHLVK